MTKSETFILNMRGDIDINIFKYFYININIPELRRYRRLQMFVKDFIIINTSAPITNQVNPNVYTLNTDTLMLQNNYDNFVPVTPSNVIAHPRLVPIVGTNPVEYNTVYDEVTIERNVLKQGSKVLAVVSNTAPYFSNHQEAYFDVTNVNGNHRFWIDNFKSQSDATSAVNQPVDFFISIVIKGSNE